MSRHKVVDAHIHRIEEVNPRLNAVVIPLFEQARKEAEAADAAQHRGDPLGPLHGVPITIKEQFLVKGTATTFGLPHQKNHRATEDGPLVKRLSDNEASMESVNKSLSRFIIAVVGLTLALIACSIKTAVVGEQQVVDIVWQALEPNTSSHTRAAWEVVRVQSVTGRDIQDLFKGPPVLGSCVPGPKPPENAPSAEEYHFFALILRSPQAACPSRLRVFSR